MRALITGSTGFIGKNLCEYLENHGIEFDTVGRDWLVPIGYNYDFIFYLAGEVRKTEDMFDANVNLLYKMLCRFIHMKDSIFVYVGSSSEYGPMGVSMQESDLINPTNLYDATKGMGTLLCQGFARQFEKMIVIVRPSSVYGKYERPEKFIPTVIRKIVAGEAIDLYPGVHDWVHVEDFIDAIFTIMEDAPSLCGPIYNVSSGIEYTNSVIVEVIAKAMGKEPHINYHTGKLHKHCTDSWCVDNSKLRALGWTQEYTLKAGLTKTVKEILEGM
jgi:dTDP-glucose 4,6-dehydratase